MFILDSLSVKFCFATPEKFNTSAFVCWFTVDISVAVETVATVAVDGREGSTVCDHSTRYDTISQQLGHDIHELVCDCCVITKTTPPSI